MRVADSVSGLSRRTTFPPSLGRTLPSSEVPTDLWIEAKGRLSDKYRKLLDISTDPTQSIVNDVLDSARSGQAKVYRNRYTIRTSSGERPLRDYVDRIVEFIGKFKAIGDTLVQYDPAHAALPWAGIRLLLSVAENDSKIFGDMAEGVEVVTGLITYYMQAESLYLIPDSPIITQLTEAILCVYTAILQYLAVAKTYYQKRKFTRYFESLRKTTKTEVDVPLSKIRSEHAKFEQLSKAVDVKGFRSIEKTVALAHSDLLDLAEVSKETNNKLEPLAQVKASLAAFQSQKALEDNADMIRWLSDIPYASHHAQMRKDLLIKSGWWLIENPRFKAWKALSSPASIWLHGKIGCGKMRLMSTVIQHFLEFEVSGESSAKVAYFYCDKSERRRTETNEVLCSIVRQLAETQEDTRLRTPIPEVYRKRKWDSERQGHLSPSKLSSSECLDLIKDFVSEYHAVILIDALDECQDINSLLDAVVKMLETGKIRVILSSRDELNRTIDAYNLPALTCLSAVENEDDINRFIESEVDSLINQKRLLHGKVSASLRNHIVSTLTAGADGMFLWVKFQLDALVGKGLKLERDIREQLQNLSSDIEQVYKNILVQVKQSGSASSSKACALLQWLYCADFPLPRKVLLEALSMNEDGTFEALTEDEAIEICGNFVIADNETDTFRFAHLSIQEFLQSQEEFQNDHVHGFAAERCARELIREHELDNEDLYVGTAYSSFYAYSLAYWDYHFLRVSYHNRSEDLFRLVSKFLFDEEAFGNFSEGASRCAKRLPKRTICQSTMDLVSNPPTPLFVICRMGCLSWLKEWITTIDLVDIDWDKTNELGNTAVMLATSSPRTELLQFLLNRNDIDPGRRGEAGFNPLLVAAKYEMVDAAKILLENSRIDVNAQNDDKESALHIAIPSESDECMELLLSHGANKELRSEGGWTPFLKAVSTSRKTTVEKLIKAGADTTATLDDGSICLHVAFKDSRAISEEVLYVLLRTKVDLNAQTQTRSPALHYAASRCSKKIIEFMVRKGADVNLKDHDGRSPLYWAAANNSIDAIKYLIQIGAVPGSDANGRTELHSLIEANGELDTVKTLVACGADAKALTSDGETVLDFALRRSSDDKIIDMINLLLDASVKLDNRSAHDQYAIHHACCSTSTAVVDLLIAEGARLDLLDDKGRSPLAYACRNASEPIVFHLIDHYHVDTGITDKTSQTMLHHAVIGGSVAIVEKILQQSQIDMDAISAEEETALHQAVRFGELAIVKILLAHRTRPLSVSSRQETLLHSVIEKMDQPQRLATVKALIEAGVNIDIRDAQGRTALHWTVLDSTDQVAIVKLLLDSGAEIDVRDSKGGTPLCYLAFQPTCNLEVMRLLLERGADANTKDNDGFTPLVGVASDNDILSVRLLLDHGAKVSTVDGAGWSVLHVAAARNADTVVRFLVDSKLCNINALTHFGSTPLVIACKMGRTSIVRYLLSRPDIDVNLPSGHVQMTPLLCAAFGSQHDIVMLLLQDERVDASSADRSNGTALSAICARGWVDALEEILKKPGVLTQVSLSLKDKVQSTPIHRAAAAGSTDVLARLLQLEGSEVDIHGENCRTPLWYAAEYGRTDTMKLLLDMGAKIDFEDRDGKTPLMNACKYGLEDTVKFLLEQGAKVKLNEALLIASEDWFPEIANILREAGAVDIEDPWGMQSIFAVEDRLHYPMSESLSSHFSAS